MTVKLYDTDAYIFEFDATVVSCTKVLDNFEVVLNKTAFFPEEGGQTSDSGKIGTANVLHVSLRGDSVVHLADSEATGECHCTLDRKSRFDKMQQHTGEHIACGIAHSLYGCENVGFHLGNTDVTFDLDLLLDKKQLEEIELCANRAVQADVKVSARYPDPSELETLDYRSKGELPGAVRIVTIDGVDRCACCAPHVSSTGQVGLIKFTDSYSFKGGTRIHMCCGMRSLEDYKLKQKNLEEIALALSAKPNNTAQFFERFKSDNQILRQKLSAISRELALQKAAMAPVSDSNILMFESDCDSNTLRLIANNLKGKYNGFCAVFSGSDSEGYSFVAASDKQDMRALAKSLQERFGARCGGSDKMIQGTLNLSRAEIEEFLK